MKRKLKKILLKLKDIIITKRLEIGEIKKFKDKRRKRIYSTIKLSDVQKREIDVLYKENYGKKVPYTWHRHFMAYTGKFDKYYFPELLYIPGFEYYMNIDKYYCNTFEDKNILPMIAEISKVKMPKTILSCSAGMYRDSAYKILNEKESMEYLKDIGECFGKPSIDSCSGKGCMLLNIKNGVDLKSQLCLKEVFNKLGKNFVIQEKLKCHKSISKIYSQSVNTFRIITYRWKNEIIHMPVVMRIGKGGGVVDNAHAGGMFIAVNDDGVLHKKAFTEFRNEYEIHPDSKIKFENYKIENFKNVIDSAKKMHTMIPQVGCVNWDFTIDSDGNPVLIEANLLGGGIWVIQMAHGKGPFGKRTPEILRWIRIMKNAKIDEREKYKFGNID
jgi:hypothetical protein